MELPFSVIVLLTSCSLSRPFPFLSSFDLPRLGSARLFLLVFGARSSSVDLGCIDLSSVDLSSVDLGSVDLGCVDLGWCDICADVHVSARLGGVGGRV
eukprot:m.13327 g.13327  ORF g.13327 m.13327 type:complete len:98 (-) comp7240_c0_seq1:568-861(-)